MAVTIIRRGFNGTTASAPSLSGTVGSLIGVLDFCLVTTLGWSKAYSGTNLAAYRAPTGNRMYLYVDDSNAQNARVRGYEAMTDISSGTGPFPTDAQVNGGLYHYKSNAASSADRPWLLLSDGKLLHFISNNDASSAWVGFSFGDFESYKSGDAYNVVVFGAHAASQVGFGLVGMTTSMSSAATGHYLARSYTQIGSSVAAGKFTDSARSNNASSLGNGGSPYPAPVEGGLLMAPLWLNEQTIGARGRLPGLWAPLHQVPLAHADTFSGAGSLSGRTFEAVRLYSGGGQVFLETSDTWGTY
jgi:hypothetical protein